MTIDRVLASNRATFYQFSLAILDGADSAAVGMISELCMQVFLS